ncbi:MAG: hypothetical protein AAB456_03045 [Patescibacteria group bacterium]
MKNKYIIILSVAAVSIFAFFAAQNVFVKADLAEDNLELASIQYPIESLGGCQNEEDCNEYCENEDHADQCLAFAVQNGLMSADEVEIARKFLRGEIEGPGGCNSKESCENYCNNIDHINQCVAFVDENDLLSDEELQEFRQVQAAINSGVKPPPCKNKQECQQYCQAPEHIEECIAFGKAAGFLEGEELQDAEKMLSAIKRGIKPPPCSGRESCEQVCREPQNMRVCLNFAIEAGFISNEEKEDALKMISALEKGVKPLSCGGREECEAYCSEHFEECAEFAVAAGFMSQEEAAFARRTGGKGPGGCTGRKECQLFCQNPDNQETCFNFAKENGGIPEADIREIEAGMQQLRAGFEQAPAEVLGCLEGKVGPELAAKIKAGFLPSQEVGEQIKECFEQLRSQGQENTGQAPPQGSFLCQTPEECEKFRLGQEAIQQQNIQQGSQLPSGQLPTGITPEQYKLQYDEQYKLQYEQERLRLEEQYRLQQQQTAPVEQPTSFLGNTLLGSLIYSLFQFLLGR